MKELRLSKSIYDACKSCFQIFMVSEGMTSLPVTVWSVSYDSGRAVGRGDVIPERHWTSASSLPSRGDSRANGKRAARIDPVMAEQGGLTRGPEEPPSVSQVPGPAAVAADRQDGPCLTPLGAC